MLTQHFSPFCAKPVVVGQGKDEPLLKNEKLISTSQLDDERSF
jgi:hypothetical protein